MSHVVAVCGKGGVGKTTVAALLSRLLTEDREKRVLVVDADPAIGLGMALNQFPPRSINDVRKEIVSAIQKQSTDSVDLAASVDYKMMEIIVEVGNLGFISVGRPEEEGCYCRLNSLLREAIESLSSHFYLTLIDAEAGIEQVNRRVMRSVTHLLLVTDTTLKGLRIAEGIRRLADEAVNYQKLGLLVNRARDEEDYRLLSSQTDLPLLGWIPEDDTVRDFDARARDFLELSSCPALEAVRKHVVGSGFLP